MTTRTRLCLALIPFCACTLSNTAWAQHHGSGGHAGGSFGFHASAGPTFGSPSVFRPAPSPAPRPFYGSPSSYHRPFAPFSFRGPGHFARPSAGFQHFRSFSGAAARPTFRQGSVPRSAYLAARNPRYSSQVRSRVPSATPRAGGHSPHLSTGTRAPLTPSHGRPHMPGRPPVFPPQAGFFNPFFAGVFFQPNPFFFSPFFFSRFFFSPFFFPTFSGWWYPPLTFSGLGCPYEDYYYQQQPYYQPEQGTTEQPSGGEAEQPGEATEETPSAPPEQPQAQTTPFPYETPLPDVIEWGKASDAVPQKPSAPAGKGPVVVNLPHHTLTILLNDPSSLTAPAPQPAPQNSH